MSEPGRLGRLRDRYRRQYSARMRRERRRRRLRSLSGLMLLVGVLLLADVGVTLAWREPVTELVHRRDRAGQEQELERREAEVRTDAVRTALRQLRSDRARLRFLARRVRSRADRGEALGRLRVPRIDLDDPIVYGTAAADLREGPAIYPDQPLPGLPGTAAIAGHRTTYGAPFRDLNRLRRGDRMTVRMSYGVFDYRVRRSRIVAPEELWVLRRRAQDRLVLSACHPLFSAAKRIVVSADLVRVRARLDGRLIDLPSSRTGVGPTTTATQDLRRRAPMR